MGVVVAVFFGILPFIPSHVYQKFQRWNIKKKVNLISGLGLVLTSFVMIGYSAYADAQLYSFTGFIMPFTTFSNPELTTSQASIFGYFASFFASTLILGGSGMMLGVMRLRKFQRFRDPTPDYIQ